MTNQPPTRASERIARRRELRQSRIAEAQRRRTARTRLRIVVAIVLALLVGLLAWFGIATFLPPAAALTTLSPASGNAMLAAWAQLVAPPFELRRELWLVS